MLLRTAFAALTVAAALVSARADSLTLNVANSSNGNYRYDFNQTNSTGSEHFNRFATFTITGLSGVTGAYANGANAQFLSASFTSTSVSYMVTQAMGVDFGPGVTSSFFGVESSVLTLGTVQYSIPTSSAAPTSTGTTLGPVAAVAVTPEPSSFALLGTGIVGVLGVSRRRLLS